MGPVQGVHGPVDQEALGTGLMLTGAVLALTKSYLWSTYLMHPLFSALWGGRGEGVTKPLSHSGTRWTPGRGTERTMVL